MRAVRHLRGLSQEGLAKVAGLHRTYISGVERAERNITLASLEKLSRALDIVPINLLGDIKER